jgi:outer membrane protein TolC
MHILHAERSRGIVTPILVWVFMLAGFAGPLMAQPPAPVNTLSMAACRQIALERQPAIAAAQASLAAAIARNDAVQHLRIPTLLVRDLSIRRQQSCLGVTVAHAAVLRAESETLYGVTYSYLAAIYAAQQEKLVEDIKVRLRGLRALAEETQTTRKDVDRAQITLVDAYLKVADGRGEEAVQGRLRALAALREAMGVGPDFVLMIPNRELPCPKAKPNKDQILAQALERRGEILQASTAERIVGLEIDAQGVICRPSARTFAANSDLHAQPLRAGIYGPEYIPGAIGIEMPASMAGSKQDRTEQAQHYHERAEAVATKTQQLIALEAEDAFLRWQDKTIKARKLEEAVDESLKYSKRINERFDRTGERAFPALGDVFGAGVLTTRLQIEALEAQFQSLAALAALERVTAGGFSVDFDAECKK